MSPADTVLMLLRANNIHAEEIYNVTRLYRNPHTGQWATPAAKQHCDFLELLINRNTARISELSDE